MDGYEGFRGICLFHMRIVEQLRAVNLVVINDWVDHGASFFMVSNNLYFYD
jgi:hypothetical protein